MGQINEPEEFWISFRVIVFARNVDIAGVTGVSNPIDKPPWKFARNELRFSRSKATGSRPIGFFGGLDAVRAAVRTPETPRL